MIQHLLWLNIIYVSYDRTLKIQKISIWPKMTLGDRGFGDLMGNGQVDQERLTTVNQTVVISNQV